MADKKEEYKRIFAEASALLKGKKNATGRAANGGIRGQLASAMYKGNAATRNNILKRFGAVNGAPAAAAVAAGVNVAAVAGAPAGSPKISNANRDAAKAALNAALKEAGRTRKAGIAAAAKYAKLLKAGDAKGAKKYLGAVLEKAAEKSGEKAADAAVKAAKANVGLSNAEITEILRRNTGKKSRPVNISKFKQALAEGKTQAEAVAAVTKMRSNAARSAAATKKAKKAGTNLEAAFNAAGKTGATGAVLVAKNNKTAKKALVKAAKVKTVKRKSPKLNRRYNKIFGKGPNYGTAKVKKNKNDPFAGIYRPFAGNNESLSPRATPNSLKGNASTRRTRRNRRN